MRTSTGVAGQLREGCIVSKWLTAKLAFGEYLLELFGQVVVFANKADHSERLPKSAQENAELPVSRDLVLVIKLTAQIDVGSDQHRCTPQNPQYICW